MKKISVISLSASIIQNETSAKNVGSTKEYLP